MAREHGFALLLCNASDDEEREAAYLDLLVDRRVDGVVIAVSGLGDRHRDWLTEPPLPVVFVNSVAEGLPHPAITSTTSTVGARPRASARPGHRHIGVLTTALALPTRRRASPASGRDSRNAGSTGSLAVMVGEPGVGGGEAAVRRLLGRRPKRPA